MTPKMTSDRWARSRRADAFHRAGIDRLDRFGIEFREHAGVVDKDRHHAGERAEPDRNDEQQREYDLVDGTAGIHQPPDRLDHPLRADVRGGEDRKRHAESCGKGRAPEGDLYRDDHIRDIVAPFVKIGTHEGGS